MVVARRREERAHEPHRQDRHAVREHGRRSSGAGASRVWRRGIRERREVGDRLRSLRPLAGERRRLEPDASHARPRGFDGLSLRERRRRWRRRTRRSAVGPRRHPARSTARRARSTRASRSCSRRPANTTRRAATRSSTVGQPVQRLVWADKQVSGLRKAKDADVYLLQEQTFSESPNYFVAGPSLADAKRRVEHERVPAATMRGASRC